MNEDSLFVCSTPDRAVQCLSLGWGHHVLFLGKTLCSHKSLSTLVYKLEPMNLLVEGNPNLVASCCGDNHRPDERGKNGWQCCSVCDQRQLISTHDSDQLESLSVSYFGPCTRLNSVLFSR